ncbi:S1 family peptidase [Hamadaea tsunoensis]|uniref:S1 family peptidase n=1 Tax=Hamadaea tsunoensis TaxID=53368 RepID=UPI0003FE12D4|nr:S1 family peptidase [Hamadaea tsunoensis]
MRRTLSAVAAAAALAVTVLTGPPAHAADPRAVLATPGVAWILDPATGRTEVTVDSTVPASAQAVLRSAYAVRHDPGRLRILIAGGDGVYATGRCSLGANVHAGTTYYFVTSGHCTGTGTTFYADAAHRTVLGTRTGTSFPVNDYGIVRYTGTVAHPSAVDTYPGLLPIKGVALAYVGMTVCRSGVTTGVRCGIVTALNATVAYAEGVVTGLIRTNICAEPGDSGGPLYDPATGRILGVLSGGTGDCTTGGTTYYQPIGEILSAYGVTLP